MVQLELEVGSVSLITLLLTTTLKGFPGGSDGKESACNAGDLGSIPGSGRSPREGNGYPLQYSSLENSMDCIIHGVAKDWKRQWHPTPVFLPGKSHGRRSLVGCSPRGRCESNKTSLSLSLFTFMHWRRKWQPTPVFLPGESQGQGSLVGCRLRSHTELDTTEAT